MARFILAVFPVLTRPHRFKDVYYLRVGTVLELVSCKAPVSVETEKNQKGEKTKEHRGDAATTLTLIKLGQEIHGPR